MGASGASCQGAFNLVEECAATRRSAPLNPESRVPGPVRVCTSQDDLLVIRDFSILAGCGAPAGIQTAKLLLLSLRSRKLSQRRQLEVGTGELQVTISSLTGLVSRRWGT